MKKEDILMQRNSLLKNLNEFLTFIKKLRSERPELSSLVETKSFTGEESIVLEIPSIGDALISCLKDLIRAVKGYRIGEVAWTYLTLCKPLISRVESLFPSSFSKDLFAMERKLRGFVHESDSRIGNKRNGWD